MRGLRIIVALVVLLGILLTLALTIPVIPERLPPGIWTDEEFTRVKPQLEEAAEKLNKMTFALTEAGYEPPVTYNLIGKSGQTSYRRTFLGTRRAGTSHQTTFSFATWMLPGVPHLNYSRTEEFAEVTPENVAQFLVWINTATEYPNAPNTKQNKSEMATPRKPSD